MRLQTSVRMSLSTRRGLPLEVAFAVTLHLPGFLPFFVSLTTRLPSEQLAAVPEAAGTRADTPHLPFPMGLLRSAAVQAPSASLPQTLSLNVHCPLMPSASQFGSQSVHWSGRELDRKST